MSNVTDEDVINSWYEASLEQRRPFFLLRPKLFKVPTGGWKVVYGANEVTGLVALGATPEKAARNFDRAFLGGDGSDVY